MSKTIQNMYGVIGAAESSMTSASDSVPGGRRRTSESPVPVKQLD